MSEPENGVTEEPKKKADWETKLEKLQTDTSSETTDNIESLKAKNKKIQEFLTQIIGLLKEKHVLCSNLDKQNKALTTQTESLKEITNITKDLLSIRNMEVGHLKDDMDKLQTKINQEKERQKAILSKMDAASTLNDKLKTEYHTQMGLFQSLKEKYEQKVQALMKENLELRKKLEITSKENEPSETGIEIN